jgi:hypothetical protein
MRERLGAELGCELFGFHLVRQLAELIEINPWFEAERVRLDLERNSPPIRLGLETGAKRLIDGVLQSQFPRGHSFFELSSHVWLQGERGAHTDIITQSKLMSRHQREKGARREVRHVAK